VRALTCGRAVSAQKAPLRPLEGRAAAHGAAQASCSLQLRDAQLPFQAAGAGKATARALR
jgi:hypothetical protein